MDPQTIDKIITAFPVTVVCIGVAIYVAKKANFGPRRPVSNCHCYSCRAEIPSIAQYCRRCGRQQPPRNKIVLK